MNPEKGPSIQHILAIETSCDDSSVAIVRKDGWVVDLISANQDEAHQPFGGVVPEIASRNHSQILIKLIDKILSKNLNIKIDGVVVTNRPGLIGSLMVGVMTAKAFAMANKIPIIGVNHLEGHLLAPFLRDKEHEPLDSFSFPFLALAVSGGHTSIYEVQDFGKYCILGETLDDAAGEAFDKFAKMLGLGFPGGVKVDHLSKTGDPKAFSFPRGLIKEDNFMMSFSGLKSAADRLLSKMAEEEIRSKLPDLCASFQEAVIEALISKLDRAVKAKNISRVIITGGVSANSRLRLQADMWAKKNKITYMIPPLRYCTDNAAMIGFVGVQKLLKGESSGLNLAPSPNSHDGDFLRG